MPTFTPESPCWEHGCRDKLMARMETHAAADEIYRLSKKRGLKSGLDVGAGSGYWTKEILRACSTRAACDLYGSPGVAHADVRELPYADNAFDVVHARRVLSNLRVADRGGALAEMRRVAKEWVIVVDVAAGARERVAAAREQGGLPMPDPEFGVAPLDHWWDAWREYPVGGAYYIWTRITLPLIQGTDVPYEHEELRLGYPDYPEEAQSRYGVHRLAVYRAL